MEADGTVGRLLSWRNYGGRWDCREAVVLVIICRKSRQYLDRPISWRYCVGRESSYRGCSILEVIYGE